MFIQFTDEAFAFIRERCFADNASGAIRLVYDSKDCGCAANGVPTLWLVDQPEEDDRLAKSNVFTVFYDPLHEVYFEERLTIDRKPGSQVFILKSASQTYTPSLKLLDLRSSRVGQ